MSACMAEHIEDKIAEDVERRHKLDKKSKGENPETAEKTRFFSDEKREKYVKEGQEDTGVPWQD